MTQAELTDAVIRSLKSSNFTDRYIELCNNFTKYDNSYNLKLKEIRTILEDLKIDFKISGTENCFFRDYTFDNYTYRFLISYKYGFIDTMFTYWNDDGTINVRGGLKKFCEMVDPSFGQKVKYKFPIATSIQEGRAIIDAIVKLHNDYINCYTKLSTDNED